MKEIIKHLDLFSGIGGFALAAKWAGFETVAFCEIEELAQKILKKNFPDVPIHNDIRDLNGQEYRGIELITGGYPCQPFSVAGQRKGEKDDRHLWPEMLRIVSEARPRSLIAENVNGHISMGLDAVLADLEAEGYTARPFVIPACSADARHRRDRVWILAHATSAGLHACSYTGLHSEKKSSRARDGKPERSYRWPTEPRVARVVDGIPSRMDKHRIKALGNAIVPQVAYRLINSLKAFSFGD